MVAAIHQTRFSMSNHLMAERHATSFFDLPRELRDMVYHFLWYEHEGMAVPYLGQRAKVEYLDTTSAAVKRRGFVGLRCRLPKWLCISKTFHNEVVDAFIERAEWTETLRARGHKGPTATSALFNPSTARVVTLGLGDLAPTTHRLRRRLRTRKLTSIAQSTRDYVEEMSRFADSMTASTRPQDVHIILNLPDDVDYDSFWDIANIDVHFLETFQRVSVKAVVFYIYDELDIKKMNAGRQKNLYDGFARMARAILGCEHVGIAHEECWGEVPNLERWIQFKAMAESG